MITSFRRVCFTKSNTRLEHKIQIAKPQPEKPYLNSDYASAIDLHNINKYMWITQYMHICITLIFPKNKLAFFKKKKKSSLVNHKGCAGLPSGVQ